VSVKSIIDLEINDGAFKRFADMFKQFEAANKKIPKEWAAVAEQQEKVRRAGKSTIAGMEALSYLKLGTTPTTEWRDAQLAKLDEASKPKAALEFVVISSVRKLVIAAAELPQLNSTPVTEWKKRVNTLASPPKK